jgi:hypothetical protein
MRNDEHMLPIIKNVFHDRGKNLEVLEMDKKRARYQSW